MELILELAGNIANKAVLKYLMYLLNGSKKLHHI